jgi:hypothetical protein
MNFWQRLFFPKTAALFDREAEIAYQREQNAKLIDAIVRGRGESPVFTVTDEKPPTRVRSQVVDDTDDWRENAKLAEDQRMIDAAVESEDEYAELVELVEAGAPGARELLAAADRRLAALHAQYSSTEHEGPLN